MMHGIGEIPPAAARTIIKGRDLESCSLPKLHGLKIAGLKSRADWIDAG